ncbi:uncharacterized protein LOC131322670 [Rhododendron vialii]|uniref:uncharacterized protein LOC131322670 n=1 Tax=Rhododendron vialii TaxID=182163 RepID=UPI0026602B18|nr:uncharacterized protein LOC131322670 [Rhododendron vialii]
MPPRTRVRAGEIGRRGGRGRGALVEDEVSQHGENPNGNPGEGPRHGQGEEVPIIQNPFARDFVAALAAANLLNPAPRESADSRALSAMREFNRRNPPTFDGSSSDPLVADHWLAQIRKLFRALKITEDDLRVNIVVVQLTGEANEWWESVLELRKDARRAARTAAQANEPDVENLTWAEFEVFFEEQYFPETSRNQLRDEFEKLEQGDMTVSEYALKFQSLSRFAPELVATEERKCRRFERGLHDTVKKFVMAQRKGKFAEVCMVGSASWYSNGGNLINLDAVLKLNYPMTLTIFNSLITGKLKSLASLNDPNYFELVSLLEFGSSSYYQYSLVFGKFDSDCCGGIDIPKNQSLGLNPGSLCYTTSRQNDVFNLEYLNECSSCSEKEHKVQYVIKFGSGYQYLALDPNTALVGEGSWDEKKNQLCIVACRFLNSSDSLDNARVGDCSIRLSLWYHAFWTIRNRTSVLGQIWTDKTVNESGYFNRITFRSRDNSMAVVPGLRYEYTVTEKVKKLCPFNKSVIKKGNRYPKWNSDDLAFDMLVEDSTGNHSWSWSKATPSFFGDQNYVLKRNTFSTRTSMNYMIAVEGESIHHGPLNITYTISLYQTSSATSVIFNSTLDISAEGLYDKETGRVCMVGCRKLSIGESMDCELLLKFQFPLVNAKEEGKIRGSIESTREETDHLYFKHLEMTGWVFYREEAKRSVQRLDLEIVMVLISYTLACVFVGLQIFYVKRNPQVLPFASLFMLVILTLGHMVTLVLNFEALFLGNRKRSNVLLGSQGWLEVNEVVVRAVTMVAFLLHLWLLQLAFSARLGDENQKDIWVAEKKAMLVSSTIYILGLFFALFLNTRNLISYGGLVLDGFLLPQILLSIFHISKENALSHPFYIGTTCVRLLPHVYDLYRAHNFAQVQFDGAYFFANPYVDFYSLTWDVVISCGGVLFAVFIYLQQRFGGRCILGRRFREVEMYEKVPVTSSEQ